MKTAFLPLSLVSFVCLTSCGYTVRPEDSIRIAKSYADLQWQPEARHIRHGLDSSGIPVQTPDTTLSGELSGRGYWKPGETATGMPYKWGGFDTPQSFLRGIAKGKKAGDVATDEKIALNNAAISRESVGVDCSGFLSRCWKLTEHISTPDLPEISYRIAWQDARMGDMLLRPGHVLLVGHRSGDNFLIYEAASVPQSRVRRRILSITELKRSQFLPWRYQFMAEPLGSISAEPGDGSRSIRWHETPY